jgi:hypothetical protein
MRIFACVCFDINRCGGCMACVHAMAFYPQHKEAVVQDHTILQLTKEVARDSAELVSIYQDKDEYVRLPYLPVVAI